MNTSAAENFINSLVRNLQVLCHSNVEFSNDIEVVGHLYLKVDKAKKFNYIVDEKVCKNDASSTVFVSNSYHSYNQSKNQSESEKDKNKQAQEESSTSTVRDASNRNVRGDCEKLGTSLNSFDNDEPPVKSQKLSYGSPESNKSSKSRQRNSVGKNPIHTKIKAEQPTVEIDLTRIKSEPDEEITQNLECFFDPSLQRPPNSANISHANFIETDVADEDFQGQPVEFLQNESSHSVPESLSHLASPSTSSLNPSASNINYLSQDLSQTPSSEHNKFHFKSNSSSYQVLEMLAVAETSPKPSVKDLAERFQMEENIVLNYLNQKDSIRECLSVPRFKYFVPNRRLTLPEKVQLIQTAESLNKPSQSMLAKQFGISQPTACRILYQKGKILEEYRISKLTHSKSPNW